MQKLKIKEFIINITKYFVLLDIYALQKINYLFFAIPLILKLPTNLYYLTFYLL